MIEPASHAIMFHHFHSNEHPVGQGSISSEQFGNMIDWLADRYSVLSAQEYASKLLNGSLEGDDICLSFDDALLCQFEVAAPVLKQRDLQAFFFVYSSPFKGEPDYLEIYRYFRMTEFNHIDDFYSEFFDKLRDLPEDKFSAYEHEFNKTPRIEGYSYLSDNDRFFRYLRDFMIGKSAYEKIMADMMTEHDFLPKNYMDRLWMNDNHIKSLESDGHVIGLHSYSHPTTIHLLDKDDQEAEYKKNLNHLNDVLIRRPYAMSHPMGRYNKDTLDILKRLGVKIGFRAQMNTNGVQSNLEIPRENHANILAEMVQ